MHPSEKNTNELTVRGGHYGLTGRIIKILKMPKKLRQGAQNSGKITSNLKLIKFSAIH